MCVNGYNLNWNPNFKLSTFIPLAYFINKHELKTVGVLRRSPHTLQLFMSNSAIFPLLPFTPLFLTITCWSVWSPRFVQLASVFLSSRTLVTIVTRECAFCSIVQGGICTAARGWTSKVHALRGANDCWNGKKNALLFTTDMNSLFQPGWGRANENERWARKIERGLGLAARPTPPSFFAALLMPHCADHYRALFINWTPGTGYSYTTNTTEPSGVMLTHPQLNCSHVHVEAFTIKHLMAIFNLKLCHYPAVQPTNTLHRRATPVHNVIGLHSACSGLVSV